MMRLCSIASGSSGNCIYVGDEDTHLLVDTGISKKRIEEGLHNLRGLAFSAGNMRFRYTPHQERSKGSAP